MKQENFENQFEAGFPPAQKQLPLFDKVVMWIFGIFILLIFGSCFLAPVSKGSNEDKFIAYGKAKQTLVMLNKQADEYRAMIVKKQEEYKTVEQQVLTLDKELFQ